MKLQDLDKNMVKATADPSDCNLDHYNQDQSFLDAKGVFTFGDINVRVLEPYFARNGYNPELMDLCLDDDKSLGLEMPQTWYLNRGEHALSIASYYNYLNFHDIVEKKGLATFNKKITDEYGRIACIEVYLEDQLKEFLDRNDIEYFGTPCTLTECLRYLEGWSPQEYPRLKKYATFSKFIEVWSRFNFPDFNFDEWYLGKDASNRINSESGRWTNVRQAIKYFWQFYLKKEHRYLAEEDIEMDILEGEKFYQSRQPCAILLSEDLFSSEDSDHEVFSDLPTKIDGEKTYLSKQKNDYPFRNAKAARTIFPNSLIVLIENDEEVGQNFSLMNATKESINTEVVITTKILRYVLENKML